MSHLLSKIMLAIFMLPLAAMLYCIAWFVGLRWSNGYQLFFTRDNPYFLAGGLAWAFIATYWYLLWRRSVRWSSDRIVNSVAAALVAALVGASIGRGCFEIYRDFGFFVATALPPLLWVSATAFIWRESASERTQRLNARSSDTLVCPNCGYNLTGLTGTRCPECGAQFTLNELIASQPARADAEVVG